jgi:hypothetical protein
MAALRHIAAIRARLLQSTDLVPILALTPDGSPAVYLGHIFNVTEPAFPCITIQQTDGHLGVWAPRVIDPGHILIDCFSKKNNLQPSEMDEFVEAMLHQQADLTSGPNACFKEIRKDGWTTALWDADTRAWRTASRYVIHAFVS